MASERPVSLRPRSTRCQLQWVVFVQEGERSWKLVLPLYYAGLFEVSFPSLLKKAVNGFQDSSTGKTRIARFANLEDPDLKKIGGFIDWYERGVCLSTNKHLNPVFSDELDFCLALDYIRSNPKADRTQIGEWLYRAKYHPDEQEVAEQAVAGLAKELCKAARMFPPTRLGKPRLLIYVPPYPAKRLYLPAALAQGVRQGMPDNFWGVANPLVVPTLTVMKQSAKNLTVDQKIAQWAKVVEEQGIKLSRPVRDCSVIIVDDLYQSGASLWSFAKYLKGQGAVTVIGLVCVKSLRDTDNQ
jgi:hypothetical protein